MQPDEGTYESTLLKEDIQHYYQGLINRLKEVDKLGTDSFPHVLLEDKDFKNHNLQPGDFVHLKSIN